MCCCRFAKINFCLFGFNLSFIDTVNKALEFTFNYVVQYAPALKPHVEEFQNRYATSCFKQRSMRCETAEYQLETYKQYQIHQECETFVKTHLPKRVGLEQSCTHCGGGLVEIKHNSTSVCTQCGISSQVIDNQEYSHFLTTTYNRGPVHRYSPEEHFAQLVHDFSGLSRRTIPNHVMNYCRKRARALKTDVTHRDVFKWLREQKFREYYSLKYIIANRLRTKREFEITLEETNSLKLHFRTYIRAIYPFMKHANIGYISSRGKYRNFWPNGFMLQRLLERIGRADLTQYVIVENTKERYELYQSYWADLEKYMGPKKIKFQKGSDYKIEFLKGIKRKRSN